MPKTILVTGAKGQLGTELQHLSSLYSDFAFTFISRRITIEASLLMIKP